MSKGGGVPLGVPSDPKCPHNRVRSQTDATPRTHALTWSVTSRLESTFAPRCVQVGGRGPAEGAGGGSIGAFGFMFMFMFMFMLSHVIPYAKHPLEIPPFNRCSASTTSTVFSPLFSLTPTRAIDRDPHVFFSGIGDVRPDPETVLKDLSESLTHFFQF